MIKDDVRIVILQRGWVLIGLYSRTGSDCTLRHASTIRKWGTSKGLGELVSGPTPDTILDYCGKVEFHRLTEVFTIECEVKKWVPLLHAAKTA